METSKPKHPQNHLAMAIISALLCCQPAGIVSIVYAAQVNSKYASGDYEGAERASQNAKTWWIVSLVLALVVWVGFILIYGLGAIFAIASGDI
ncbi:Interferon-induced transmembrane protein [Psychroflexus salarius]|uniref:Interferon-induced transmembrane protein n=1 Tax=Psychroflexus salarius TaxID=1155689 RepID=A0A1M4TE41_9FLAO|nr:CD225/dispanin family protein [Psychroflexus salarius]SHE42746.1 Interferon-induced transmembrane protein [Psychroflexus salarius]